MKGSMLRRGFALLLAATAAVALPGAAAATQADPAYGAKAICRYQEVDGGKYGWNEALFQKIVVTPPVLFSKNSANQKVGWRFSVRRSMDFYNGPWKVTYSSPIQKAMATPTKAAPFSKMTVGVAVPQVEDQDHVAYQITLKLFWYAPNGAVWTTSTYRFTEYGMYVGKHYQGSDALYNYCPGYAYQFYPHQPAR